MAASAPTPAAGNSRGRAVAATVLSGVLYGVAFPPLDQWWLAWVALVPFFLALRGAGFRRALGLGALWGVIAAYAVGTWMPRAITLYYEQPLAAGVLGFLTCAAITVAPYTAAFALLERRLVRRPTAATPLLVAAAWSATELWRATSPLGNPWSLLGHSQVSVLPVIQIADCAGVFGVSFAVAAVNAALAEWWARGLAATRGLAAVVAVVVGVLLYGAVRLHGVTDAAPPVEVAVVQGNLDLGKQWKAEFYGANLQAYLGLTAEALAHTASPLVVWPEGTLTFFLENEMGFRGTIARTLSVHGAQLLTGGPREVYRGPGEPRYLNAAFLLQPGGEVAGVYEKQFLLPFAEYFPLPQLDFLRRRFGKVREFSPGTEHDPLPTVAGRAGLLICNEALYGSVAADRVARGAEYLVNLTNDTWGGERTYALIAFAMSSLRAVEQRRWLVRSSTSGPSAVIDPAGRIVARIANGARTAISAGVARRSDRTLYAHVGDLFGWLTTAVVLGAVWRARA